MTTYHFIPNDPNISPYTSENVRYRWNIQNHPSQDDDMIRSLSNTEWVYDWRKPKKIISEAFIGHLVRSFGGTMSTDVPRTYAGRILYVNDMNYTMYNSYPHEVVTSGFDDHNRFSPDTEHVYWMRKSRKRLTFSYIRLLYGAINVEVVDA